MKLVKSFDIREFRGMKLARMGGAVVKDL